jgi:peptidoglycan/LPS O-acetylase OafA/YrhL
MSRRLIGFLERAALRVTAGVAPEQQDWVRAALAELAAMPPDRPQVRWALGVLRFALARRLAAPRRTSATTWGSRAFAALGALSVAPWLAVSVQGLRDDAPDGTHRSLIVMLVAQLALLAAFASSWSRSRAVAVALPLAVAGYVAAAAFAAADNGGSPLVSALVFGAVPALTAAFVLMPGRRDRTPRPTSAPTRGPSS